MFMPGLWCKLAVKCLGWRSSFFSGKTQPERVLSYITKKAEKGNVEDVIKKMDEFVQVEGAMNVGPNKGYCCYFLIQGIWC